MEVSTDIHGHVTRRDFLRGGLLGAAAVVAAPSLRRIEEMTPGRSLHADASASGTLTFMTWDPEAVMQPVVALFEKLHPGVSVEMSYAPPVTQYITTLQERLLAGTAADVFIYTSENAAALNKGNFVVDLTNQPWVRWMATANRQFMAANGRVWGLSPASWAGGIIYNKAILAKAGYSAIPRTWADFLAMCARLKKNGVTPYFDAGTPGVALEALVGSYYLKTYGKNIDPEIFDGKLTFLEAWEVPLTTYSELYSEGLVSPAVIGLTGTEMDSQLAVGQLAMLGSGPWDVAAVQKENPKIQLFMGAVPGPQAGQSYWCGAPNEGWAINAKAQNRQAALAFLSFLASPQGLKAYTTSAGSISTMSDYSNPVNAALPAAATAARQSTYYYSGVSWPSVYDTQLTTVLVAELQAMFQGKATVKEVLTALDDKLDQLRKS